MRLGLGLHLGGGRVSAAPFTVTITSLVDGEARPGAVLGYTTDPPDVGVSQVWTPSAGTGGTGTTFTVPAEANGGTVTLVVTDAEGNEVPRGVAVRVADPVALTAPSISNTTPFPGDTVTITEGTYTNSPTITGTLELGGVDVSADMVGLDYTVPLAATIGAVLVWEETATNTGGSETQTASATVTEAPNFTLSETVDGELEINGATGEVTVVITSPAAYAGTYIFDSALLATGPVNLVAPVIVDDGTPAVGETLTSTPGLWIYDPDNGGLGSVANQWTDDGADIIGATATSFTVTSSENNSNVRLRETLTDNGGTRSATSDPVEIGTAASSGVGAWAVGSTFIVGPGVGAAAIGSTFEVA